MRNGWPDGAQNEWFAILMQQADVRVKARSRSSRNERKRARKWPGRPVRWWTCWYGLSRHQIINFQYFVLKDLKFPVQSYGDLKITFTPH